MERYAVFFANHRRLVFLFVALATLLGAWCGSRLGFDDVPRSIFRAGDEESQRLEQLFADFGSDDLDCLVVLQADDWFVPARAELLRELARDLDAIDGVERVIGLPSVPRGVGPFARPLLPPPDAGPAAFEAARAAAAAHPLVHDQLLSADGRTTLLVVVLREGLVSVGEIRPIVRAIDARLEAVSAQSGVTAGLTGVPPIRVEIFDVVESDNVKFVVLAALVSFFVAWAVFRHLGTFLAAAAPAVLGGIWSLAAIAVTGGEIDILKSILPTIVMTIGLTDSVHIVTDVRHMRAQGLSAIDAATESIRHLGVPCLLTSVTTAVGFASLAISDVDMIRGFGLAATLGVGLTFVAVLTAAPLFASALRRMSRPLAVERETVDSRLSRVFERGIDTLLDHARAVSLAGLALTVLCAWFAFRLEPDNRLTEVTPADRESVRSLRVVDQAFGGSMFAGVVVSWPAGVDWRSPGVASAIDAVERAVERAPLFSGALSVLDLRALVPGGAIELLPEALRARFVRPDLHRALVRARLPDTASSEHERASLALEVELARIEAEHPQVDLHLTGTAIVARRNIDGMIVDFALGLALAAAVIFVVIALALRSLRLGLVSLVPNALPVVLVAALLYATGGTLQMASSVAFTILLAVAVDDTIHVLTRMRRELDAAGDGDVRAALRRALIRIAPALVITTVIMLAGFGAVLLSEVPTNRAVAAICCTGFVAALAGDLVLLPALVVAFGGAAPAARNRAPGLRR